VGVIGSTLNLHRLTSTYLVYACAAASSVAWYPSCIASPCFPFHWALHFPVSLFHVTPLNQGLTLIRSSTESTHISCTGTARVRFSARREHFSLAIWGASSTKKRLKMS